MLAACFVYFLIIITKVSGTKSPRATAKEGPRDGPDPASLLPAGVSPRIFERMSLPRLSPQLDLPFVDSKNQNQNHQLENTVRLVSAQTGLWV